MHVRSFKFGSSPSVGSKAMNAEIWYLHRSKSLGIYWWSTVQQAPAAVEKDAPEATDNEFAYVLDELGRSPAITRRVPRPCGRRRVRRCVAVQPMGDLMFRGLLNLGWFPRMRPACSAKFIYVNSSDVELDHTRWWLRPFSYSATGLPLFLEEKRVGGQRRGAMSLVLFSMQLAGHSFGD